MSNLLMNLVQQEDETWRHHRQQWKILSSNFSQRNMLKWLQWQTVHLRNREKTIIKLHNKTWNNLCSKRNELLSLTLKILRFFICNDYLGNNKLEVKEKGKEGDFFCSENLNLVKHLVEKNLLFSSLNLSF